LQASAIIIAGGFSKRFGQDKGLINLASKPLILYVIDRISPIVSEIIVVVHSKEQENVYAHFTEPKVHLARDTCETQSPLVGALTGFEAVHNEHALLLPCDTPFVSTDVMQLILELCASKDAVIPRWPNGYVEPLQAAYNALTARVAATKALEAGKLDMRSMIANMRQIRYLSTLVVEQLDPEYLTFFNINTPVDLKRAEHLLQPNASLRRNCF
jgi:molybdopterin-guanine dinucleotide biosynthesis protein A